MSVSPCSDTGNSCDATVWIRPVAVDDIPAVLTIETLSPSQWGERDVLEELDRPGSICLAACLPDGRLAGWCCGRLIAPEAELLKIAVSQEQRRQGLASKLLQALQATLVTADCETLFLEVRSANQPALSFYFLHNFVQVGSRRGYYRNPPDDALLLEKRLT